MCRTKQHKSPSSGVDRRQKISQTPDRKQHNEQKVYSVDTEFFVDTVQSVNKESESWIVPILINKTLVPLKLDTGSDVNILGYKDFQNLLQKPKLNSSKVLLKAYDGGNVPVKGQCVLELCYKDSRYRALFIISDEDVRPILGCKSCEKMGLVKRVLSLEHHIETDIKEYADTFEGLGCLPGKVSIKLHNDAIPVVEPCRKVPFALYDKLKAELHKMEDMKVIEKIEEPTEWVNSLVVVHKANGKLRVCMDPRNLNKAILQEHFKLPTREEIMSRFAGAKVFSKLDASNGFWQIQLDEQSSRLCTFNSPIGRFRFLRLPFGISSAPEIYHRIIHSLFEHMDGVDTSMEDIIVWGKNEQEHNRRLCQVLEKARKVGLKLQKEKCEIGVSELTFLGDTLSKDGLKPDPKKVEAICSIETPTCKKDLQRFLGMIKYLACFLPDLSERTATLRELLDKNNNFDWTPNHDTAFEKLKSLVSSKYFSIMIR
ncbi:uncharacterized protein K02A2.6-like [Gigantopelta aegis]|uniref:uncharacterized protein K02A2.6-like n=1 Tax=Gigantopelta aegis TaxID=1735272 RepID=UPI001B889FBB|nr:uncharacterized protein K02A2.6-like [Gigantopelta aegis]